MVEEVVMEVVEDVAKGVGSGSLIRAALESCPCDDDENIKDSTKRGDSEDDSRNGDVDLPEIVGKSGAEK
jgi:hypothetical protein